MSGTDRFAVARDENGALRGTHFVIFDGACGFCIMCIRVAARLDRRSVFAYMPLQWCTPADFTRFRTSERACRRALHVIDGRATARGAGAVNRFLWSIGTGRPFVIVLWCVWPLLLAEYVGYAIVAGNRTTISRLLKTQDCALLDESR